MTAPVYNASEAERQAIADLTVDFERAVVGLQMNNPDVPTISPQQYSLMLGATIYAAQCAQTRGVVLPPEDAQLSFSDFLNAAGTHYAQLIVEVAVAKANEVLENVKPLQDLA